MASLNYKHILIGLCIGFLLISITPLVTNRMVRSDKAYLGCRSLSDTGLLDLRETQAVYDNRLTAPLLSLAEDLTDSQKKVLGAYTGEKWIEIDLSDQKLTAHQGDVIVLESLISSGLWNRTPVGEYRIWYKIKSTKMEGGSKLNNSYYYLPNVPYAMFFNSDIGIHGTYWHSDFGRPKSHGCVNAPTPIAEKLYYWADPQTPQGKNMIRSTSENPGTRVIVHE